MVKILMDTTHCCEISYKEKEPAHCYITRMGKRVAKVLLCPVVILSDNELVEDEAKMIYKFVNENRLDLFLQYQYEYSRKNGLYNLLLSKAV